MNTDDLIRKSLKFFANLFWLLLIILSIAWYFQNKDRFFPASPPVEEINNINPFQ